MLNKKAGFVIITVTVLILHLVFPIAALADGETPATPTDTAVVTSTPEPATGTPEPPVIDTSTPTPDASASPVADPVESATPTPEDPSTPTSTEPTAPLDSTPTDQTTLLETIQSISDTTNVVVLDENGQPIPLASQDATEIIAESDPMWCPGTSIPAGRSGCYSAFTVSDLLNQLVGVSDDGTVYFEAVYWNYDATFDGNDPRLTNLKDSALTLQGGWDSSTDNISGNSLFLVPLTIANWNNNVTINNITEYGYFSNGNGISVTNVTGQVNLNTVDANSNYDGDGVSITNVTGEVNLTNVTATSNHNWYGGGGIYIQNQDADVTLKNITATNNYIYGVLVKSTGNVTMEGTNNASYNGEGIAVFSDKMVNLSNITATDNWWGGVYVYKADNGVKLDHINASYNEYGVSAISTGHVELSNINVYGNWWDGIGVIADSATLTNIYSDGNIYDYWQSYYGIALSTSTSGGTIELDNVNVHNNCIGISVLNNLGTLDIKNSNISFNTFGIQKSSPDTVVIDPNSSVSNNQYDFTIGGECESGTPGTLFLPVVIIDIGSGGVFDLDCNSQGSFAVRLPNGDRVTIVCPVSGRAHISRLDNTSLPADLPEGFTYASAFSLEIWQGVKYNIPIKVIDEGGYIKASFDAASLQPGADYSILYLDNGKWIQLKDFLVDEKGNPRIFDLKPGDSDNQGRLILSGVKFDKSSGYPRIEVSTNFPGVYALVQH